MENIINLSFEGAEEVRSLFSEAGADGGKKVKITIEASLTELTEEGAMLVPDSVESVFLMEDGEEPEAKPEPEETGEVTEEEDAPGMVVLMNKKKKAESGDDGG